MRVRSAVIVVVVAIAGSQNLWCKPQAEGGPQRLGEQVWKIVDQKFLDPPYNHHDPRQIRDQLLAMANADTSQIYAAVRTTLALLGDPQTRLLALHDNHRATLIGTRTLGQPSIATSCRVETGGTGVRCRQALARILFS